MTGYQQAKREVERLVAKFESLSEDIIDAMDLRAFGIGPRTWLEQLRYRRRDYVLIALAVLLLIFSVIFSLFGYGQLWVPDWALAWAD